jgi:hypothetical protein
VPSQVLTEDARMLRFLTPTEAWKGRVASRVSLQSLGSSMRISRKSDRTSRPRLRQLRPRSSPNSSWLRGDPPGRRSLCSIAIGRCQFEVKSNIAIHLGPVPVGTISFKAALKRCFGHACRRGAMRGRQLGSQQTEARHAKLIKKLNRCVELWPNLHSTEAYQSREVLCWSFCRKAVSHFF